MTKTSTPNCGWSFNCSTAFLKPIIENDEFCWRWRQQACNWLDSNALAIETI